MAAALLGRGLGMMSTPGNERKETEMADYTVKKIDEMEAVFGGAFKRARAELGVTSFGMQVIDMPPNADQYPEHDHEETGQEEVFVVLRGSAEIEVDGERIPHGPRDADPGGPGAQAQDLAGGRTACACWLWGRRRARSTRRPTSPQLGAPDPSRAERVQAAGRRARPPANMRAVAPGYRIMGVVNVTPDSFSDGGRFLDRRRGGRARRSGWRSEGADMLDVGGSTSARRAGPGDPSRVGDADEELPPRAAGRGGAWRAPRPGHDLDRHLQARGGRGLPWTPVPPSSTTSPPCAATPDMVGWWPSAASQCCLMHMLGEPRTMQRDPRYDDVVDDVRAFLEERLAFAVSRGVAEERVLLDPGIGFGKTLEHNLALLAPAGRDRRDRPPGRGRRLAQVVPGHGHRPRRG